MRNDPTFIGKVQNVSGATVTVELNGETVTGLSFVNGEGYRVGQVGSFVRIPLGFVNLYGVVSQVGAGAAPEKEEKIYGNMWLKVQMVGEGRGSGEFERGISQHPTIEDQVHIVTHADLAAIYGAGDPSDFVTVGRLASAESIPSLVNINKLITRHSAVVGTTGSGKSTTVAGLLNSLSDPEKYPSSRILVLDIHGEYGKALSDRGTIFRISPDTEKGQKALNVPFWALSFDELIKIALGNVDDNNKTAIGDVIVQLKQTSLSNQARDGIDPSRVTVDSPVPFSIRQLWFDLHQRVNHTFIPKADGADDEVEVAYVLDNQGLPLQKGDAATLTPPMYRTVKTTGTAKERVQLSRDGSIPRKPVATLFAKLRDPRLDFLFNPDPERWAPDTEGNVSEDMDTLLEEWIGGPQPITILDLSGIPSSILNDLIGALLRILYDAIFWARNIQEGGWERPLLIVLEEAHAYLSKENSGTAAMEVRRIAKEGRKYGVGMMIVSQRPSEIDTTILSQCGTIFAMRLANEIDRGHITSAASDNLKGLFDMLPVLRTGEAIIVGEAVSLPIRTLITPPIAGRRPDSEDPKVVVRKKRDNEKSGAEGYEGPGSWVQGRNPLDDYSVMVKQWRLQSPRYLHQPRKQSTD